MCEALRDLMREEIRAEFVAVAKDTAHGMVDSVIGDMRKHGYGEADIATITGFLNNAATVAERKM